MFSRRHYEVIARTVREIIDAKTRHEVAELFARRLEIDNPRFNREQFLNACSAQPIGKEKKS